jgi:hypothetical protein
MRKSLVLPFAIAFMFLFFGYALTIHASHSWGGYHWARTSNPFTLKLGDNVSGDWDAVLRTTSSDWSQSSVLDTTVVGGLSNPKNCKATAGRVEVCNNRYGNNGWLGIAQIWISNGTHITQAVTKLNDTYFNTPKYNTTAWRNLVSCQEVGHTFGLDHQDENFSNANLNTCMDYTNDPTSNQHPNAHDYEELALIYAHLDTSTTIQNVTVNNGGNVVGDNASDWGRAIKQDGNGKSNLFRKDLGNGIEVYTHVFWAE